MTKLANLFTVLIVGGVMLYLWLGAKMIDGIEKLWRFWERKINYAS